jgi:hypothetical protein
MNFLKHKLSSKTIIYASIVFMLTSMIVVFLFNTNNISDITISPDLLFSITPTPYPLPTQAYNSPSYFTTIFGQIFGKGNQSVDPSQIATDGQQQVGNQYLDLYSKNDYLPVDIQWWQKESKQVYEYVNQRFGATVSEKVIVTFVPQKSGNCAPRGTTFHEQRPIIVIFANQGTSKEQILAVLAHELGHVFIHQKYENLSDVALNEGMATWAAGDYWKGWKGVDFNSGVVGFVNDKTYLPLFQNFDMSKAYDDNSPDCIIYRDVLLTELASFLDYLIRNYGSEKLSALFDIPQPELVNNQRVVYPPNFKDVYGLEFNQLEYEWLKTLFQPSQ